jgi:hypothetical protein
MAGNTATIDATVLQIQWDAYVPMVEICAHWTITKDQLIRLRDVWGFQRRNDRRRRYKPPRARRPDAAEERASQESLELAPLVAARVTCVQATWDAVTRESRAVRKSTPFAMKVIDTPDDVRRYLDDWNADAET